jgi:PQQ-dependent catabolism-associated beta-propeller protein
MAHFIDAHTFKMIDSVLVDKRPRVAVFSKDGSRLWVSSEVGGAVAVIDPKTHKIIKKIKFEIPGLTREEIQPVGIRLTSDGKTAFVALGPANRVAVVDAETFEVRKFLLVGQRVWHLALTPDEKLLFTTNGNSNDVSVIDVASLKVIKSIPVGQSPLGVASSPN